jgi:hypothetical protein
MMNEQPADRGPDEEVLRQRLAMVAAGGSQPTVNGFRRRRSSGLLFQIRRRVRRPEPDAPSLRRGPPAT